MQKSRRTFRRGFQGVVRHHHLVGGRVDLGPLDELLVAASSFAGTIKCFRSDIDRHFSFEDKFLALGYLPQVAADEAEEAGLLIIAAETKNPTNQSVWPRRKGIRKRWAWTHGRSRPETKELRSSSLNALMGPSWPMSEYVIWERKGVANLICVRAAVASRSLASFSSAITARCAPDAGRWIWERKRERETGRSEEGEGVGYYKAERWRDDEPPKKMGRRKRPTVRYPRRKRYFFNFIFLFLFDPFNFSFLFQKKYFFILMKR